jgi:hypothetical protein
VSRSSSDKKAEPTDAGPTRSLFAYEVRRDGRVVATLEGRQSDAGTTVETEVFPSGGARREEGISRPFTFGTPDQARRFADEAVVVFEYLNCTIT